MKLARIEAAVRVVMRCAEALQRRDESAFIALLDTACRFEDPWGRVFVGPEAVLTFWRDLWTRAPQLHLELEQVHNVGMRCVVCWTLSGLPDGPAPIRGVSIVLVYQDRIRDLSSYIQLPRCEPDVPSSTEMAVVVK